MKLKAVIRETSPNELPYFMDYIFGPVITVDEETEIELYEFCKAFNEHTPLDALQICYEDYNTSGEKKV